MRVGVTLIVLIDAIDESRLLGPFPVRERCEFKSSLLLLELRGVEKLYYTGFVSSVRLLELRGMSR